jgi:hypothetical protein
MYLYGLAWFLSVAWLMLTVQLTTRIENEEVKQGVETVMVALWVLFGIIPFFLD